MTVRCPECRPGRWAWVAAWFALMWFFGWVSAHSVGALGRRPREKLTAAYANAK